MNPVTGEIREAEIFVAVLGASNLTYAEASFKKTKIEGKPDMAHVSTSYVERANLTMRMHNRRFTRLTNAFSKKFENHSHMVAIYTVWYNWIRIHKSLRVTPAMAAGISETVMNWTDNRWIGFPVRSQPITSKRFFPRSIP